MVHFNKKLLTAAVSSAVFAAAGSASAVVLNPDGVGEALIYPYYTAQGNNATFVSIVNTTTQAKVVKVRFREAKNSNDVLDFNLYLSPYDVWTGVVTRNAQGGARLSTNDTSCTDPAKADWGSAGGGVYYVDFFPFDYRTVDGDATQGLGRTLEGYMEVIEMATIPPSNTTLFNAIKHNPTTGRPTCTGVAGTIGTTGLSAPTGGLFGGGAIVDLSASASGGMAVGYGASAYGDFNRTAEIFAPSAASPNFADHGSTEATIITQRNNVIRVGSLNTGRLARAEAFAMVNMGERLVGEYSIDKANVRAHGTDWVITFPGKHYFTNRVTWLTNAGDPHGEVAATATAALPPFTTIWDRTNRRACEVLVPTSTSREEDRETTRSTFSPQPPGPADNQLCFETNVISFGTNPATTGSAPSSVFGASDTLWYLGNHDRNDSGWLDLDLTRNRAGTIIHSLQARYLGGFPALPAPSGSVTVLGLPVIGFKATVSRVTSSPTLPLNNYADGNPLHPLRTVRIGGTDY
ncbi:MAG: hypothetical protein N3F11_01575 [Casimicrobiaceae bacterium]|nr:hypothetical protein [Casimicrobiaceae bacterium]